MEHWYLLPWFQLVSPLSQQLVVLVVKELQPLGLILHQQVALLILYDITSFDRVN